MLRTCHERRTVQSVTAPSLMFRLEGTNHVRLRGNAYLNTIGNGSVRNVPPTRCFANGNRSITAIFMPMIRSTESE